MTIKCDFARVPTCRFCRELMSQGVKYGPTHFAHYSCFLKSGKPLSKISTRALRGIPAQLLLEHGRLEEAMLILGKEDRIDAEAQT